ncbi:MAG: ABC transporter ATP-binding protein [Planctomycetes bacterium]|nr:ABC transporter ATP-binding protein [Planctomycetota bacterium]
MARVQIVRTVPVVRTPRVQQLAGMFDVPLTERSSRTWEVNLPLEERDWQLGLIVGPSGCGKSTLARELFPGALVNGYDWPADRSIVDAFPAHLGITEITGLLSSVGFSSPPSWLRPFAALSNGEQFRVTIARALAEQPGLAVLDEFTSVVDRTVARIGSAAIARTIRRSRRRLVAVTCHYDIVDWLDPDWVYDPAADEFTWRSLRRGPGAVGGSRPAIELEITRVHRAAWRLFKPHHYLSGDLHPSARCFLALVRDAVRDSAQPQSGGWRPAAFTAVLSSPDAKGGYWREHRTVCLPDFQGVGLGNALSEFVAGVFVATGKRYCSRTSHPAMIRHRARSPLWQMTSGPSFGSRQTGTCAAFNRSAALDRLTVGFRYVGPAQPEAAARLGIAPAAPRKEQR